MTENRELPTPLELGDTWSQSWANFGKSGKSWYSQQHLERSPQILCLTVTQNGGEANTHQNQYFTSGISLGSSSRQTPLRINLVWFDFSSKKSSVTIRSTTKPIFQIRDPWKSSLSVRIESELGDEIKFSKTDFFLGGVCIEEDPSEIPEGKYWFWWVFASSPCWGYSETQNLWQPLQTLLRISEICPTLRPCISKLKVRSSWNMRCNARNVI